MNSLMYKSSVMVQKDKTIVQKKIAFLHIKKNRTTFATRLQILSKKITIKIYSNEKNIPAFQQEEKEQARFP